MKARQASELGNLQLIVERLDEVLAEARRTNQLLEWLGALLAERGVDAVRDPT